MAAVLKIILLAEAAVNFKKQCNIDSSEFIRSFKH
jgi:hypothetical protein